MTDSEMTHSLLSEFKWAKRFSLAMVVLIAAFMLRVYSITPTPFNTELHRQQIEKAEPEKLRPLSFQLLAMVDNRIKALNSHRESTVHIFAGLFVAALANTTALIMLNRTVNAFAKASLRIEKT